MPKTIPMIGQKVRFWPSWADKQGFTPAEREEHKVTGNVIFVNIDHKMFVCEYGLRSWKLREGFKFSDIGQEVTLCG